MSKLGEVVAVMQQIASAVRDETNAVVASNDHIALIRHYDALRKVLDTIKESREAMQEISDTLSKDKVPEAMRAAGVKTVTVEGVGRVTISHRFSCSMFDSTEGIKWLKAHNYGDLVKETVNSQTLSSFARGLIEDEGKELPADLFKVGTSPFTSITKVK